MKIKIVMLTPVYIGGDQADNLSPYSDYIWQNGEFIYIDNKKLEAFLTRELVNEWVAGIRDDIDNNRSNFSLAEFLANNNIPIDKVSRRQIPLSSNPQRKAIRRFVHSGGRPFVPGSSLKGAIRTAFVYRLVKQTENGKKFLKDLISKLNERMPFKEQKNLMRFEFLKKISNLLDRTPQTDPFKNFLISDSQFIPFEEIQIASMWRYHLKKLSEDSPSWREVVRQGAVTYLTLQLKNDSNLADHFWKSLADWGEICSVLNEFSKESINFEIEALKDHFFFRVSNFYKQLEQQINNLESGEAIIRIGAGKTFFDNTIDLLFANSKEFFRFRELFDLGKKPGVKGKPKLARKFPISRFFIGGNKTAQQPLGWIKLTQES